jgi:putative flippase GtrA
MNLTRFHASLTPHAVKQLMRYGASGVSAVITDYGSFALLYGVIKTPLIVATITSLLAGFVVSFLLNRLWVFGAHKQAAHKKAPLQFALYSILFGLNTAFTYLFIYYSGAWFGLSAYVGKLCCIGLIMIWNFVVYKKIIFRVAPTDDFQAM